LLGGFAIAEIWRLGYDEKRAERPIATAKIPPAKNIVREVELCAKDAG
jgi:hypothetical protein